MLDKLGETHPKLVRFIRTAISKILFILLYFSKQKRFDRDLAKTALAPDSIARMKAERARVWADKKRSGRLLIQQGGEIKAKPFPARGSLLTDEERNDPLAR